MSQLVLPIRLDDHAVFESFHAAGNETLVSHLKDVSAGTGAGAWVFGPPASGKTHLLQAACAAAGNNSVYLSRDVLEAAAPPLLDGLAARGLVAIDDLEQIIGQPDWETALFALFNALQDSGGQLVIASATAPREAQIKLRDLESRFMLLPAFRLHALDDAERARALKLRASNRGLDLPDETANYLLSRSRRDMQSLYTLLDHLDAEALRAKRRLTIPFVRECLAGEPDVIG